MTTPAKPKALWYSGVCDQVLAKLEAWYKHYELGEVHSTRQYMDVDGIKDLVQRRAHNVPWKQIELDHLVKILETLRPTWAITQDFRKVRDHLQSGRLIQGGARIIKMAFYQEDVKETIAVLLEAKTGRKQSLTEIAKEQKEEGKDIFEM